MLVDITSVQSLGLLIRASRKSQKVRMDDLAGTAGVGPVFVREVERGKETVQLGRVLQLLTELGIQLKADVACEVVAEFARLKLVGVKPLKRRRPPGPSRLNELSNSATTPDPKSRRLGMGKVEANE